MKFFFGETLDWGDYVIVVLVLVLLFGSLAVANQHRRTIRSLRVEAVQRGFGEWKVAPDGSTTFVWKGGKP